MPDVVLLVKAIAVGALVAAAVLWLGARAAQRVGRFDSFWSSAGWSWAIGAGVIAASGATDQWPHWPALEDRARFLTLLVPLTVLVESLAAVVRSRGVAWSLRVALAAVVTPIVLHNSVYLADLSGGHAAQWSRAEAIAALGGLATLLALLWTALGALQFRTSTRTIQWLLAFDAAATAATVMLSGYFRAGVLGLGLAGAIAGVALAAPFAKLPLSASGGLGVGVIGIFSLALMGRFFGALSSTLAIGLLLAPLLAWGGEAPRLRAVPPVGRNAARFVCVLVPLVVIVIVAQRQFTAASTARSKPSPAAMAPDGPTN